MMVMEIAVRRWPLNEPFTVSRGTMHTADGVIVTLERDGARGRGEAYGITYEGETTDSILAQIEAVRPAIAGGAGRDALMELLPVGGARCALDAALWDLEAKLSGRAVHALAGWAAPRPVETAFTIGMRQLSAMRAAAQAKADYGLIKLKVDREDPLRFIREARAGAPASRFIVDPNQSWTIADIAAWQQELVSLGVVLLEQPVAVDQDEGLAGLGAILPICADEAICDRMDLAKVRGKYSHINIKLDKTGGLTEAIALADAALAEGFGLMVGCMAGSSLAMAPAHLIAQKCEFVDLDGPLLQSEDWPDAMVYESGRLLPPSRDLWG
jgi:L-alanine-DL-glutamate epimerase-like enolase superfamily enzyme